MYIYTRIYRTSLALEAVCFGGRCQFVSMGVYVDGDRVYFHLEIASHVYTWGLFVYGALARWPSCLPSSLDPRPQLSYPCSLSSELEFCSHSGQLELETPKRLYLPRIFVL